MDRPSRSEGAIVVKLRLEDGEEVPLKVDTGGPETILDESFASKLGPRIGTKPAAFAFNLRAGAQGIYRAPKLYAGDTELLTGSQVYTVKSAASASQPGKGILGMDCLRHYCIQFDFAAGKMRFLEPDHLDTNELGEPFLINMGPQGHTFFDADLLGQGKMRFLLDTGMDGPFDAMLAPKVFERLLHQYPTIGPDLYMTVPDGRAASGNIFPRVSLRGQTYTDLWFSSVDLRPRRVKGIIGMRFLARHKITLNFPKRTLYFKCISSAPLAAGPSASQHQSVAPTGGRRFAQSVIGHQRRLLPVADGGP
jgi:hypothetical protein